MSGAAATAPVTRRWRNRRPNSAQAERHEEVAGLAIAIEEFCARVQGAGQCHLRNKASAGRAF